MILGSECGNSVAQYSLPPLRCLLHLQGYVGGHGGDTRHQVNRLQPWQPQLKLLQLCFQLRHIIYVRLLHFLYFFI